MNRRRTLAPLLALGVLALGLVAGCSLGEKEGFADRVRAVPALAVAQGSVGGTIRVEVELVDAPVEVPDAGSAVATVASRFSADLAGRRSVLDDVGLRHDGLLLAVRKADAKPNDARPWLTLSLADVTSDASIPFRVQQPLLPPAAVLTLPPALLVDLLDGALTGSLELVGDATIDGEATTEYTANLGLDKMLADLDDAYDDDTVDDVHQLFDILHLSDDVSPARVWLRPDGLARRIEIGFAQRPRRSWEFRVTVTMDLAEWGVPFDAAAPADEESIRVNTVSRVTTELNRALGLDASGLPAGVTLAVDPTPSTLPPETGATP